MKHKKHSTMAKRSLAVLLAGAMMLTVVPVDNRAYAMDVEEETGTEATEAEKNVMTEAAEPDEKKTTTEASEPTEKNVMTETAEPEEKKAMAEEEALTEGDIAINADAENDTTYTYTVEDGTYTYTVDEEGNATITDYAGEATTINIPDVIDGHMVTVIGDFAFYNCTNLKEITLPAGVTEIGQNVFANCTSLENIVLPEDVTKIGFNTFNNCVNLKEITLPAGVTWIESRAFSGCKSLSTIVLPEGLTILGDMVFSGTSITSITIPKSLERCNVFEWGDSEEDNATVEYRGPFYSCSTLKTINFEEGTTRIAAGLFAGFEGVENVTIPESVTEIGSYAFSSCTNLKEITLPAGVTEIGSYAFSSCTNLKEITLPAGVAEIGSEAFAGCKNLSAIDLPKGLTTLGSDVFANTSITSITIPKALENCDGYVAEDDGNRVYVGPFSNCSTLKTVYFEEGTTRIASYLFAGCKNLSEIDLPKGLTELGKQAFSGTSITSITIPKSLEVCDGNESWVYDENENYIAVYGGPFSDCSMLKTVYFEEGTTEIASYLFAGCEGINNITIPDTVTEIGNYVFAGCKNLSRIDLPKELKELGGKVFAYSSITKIKIPKSLKKCGGEGYSIPFAGPFMNCNTLKTIEFEAGTTEIASGLCYMCDGIETITIPETVTKIGAEAFSFSAIKEITLPDAVTEIGDEAFAYCENLSEIELPEGLTEVGKLAFSDTSITSITIPKSLEQCEVFKRIDSEDESAIVEYRGPFYNCSTLKTINFKEGTTRIAAGLFAGFDGVVNVTIPDTVMEIGNFAFAGCTNLKEIMLPAGVASIENGAFKDCSNLTRIYMGANITSIADDALNTPEQTVIYGVSGTYPQTFAEEKGFTFIDRDAPEIQITGISLNKTEVTLKEKDIVQIMAEVAPTNATNKKLNWKSSASAVATVDSTGRVTAVAAGSAVITCSATDGSGVTATCKVTVTKPEVKVTGITLDKTEVSLKEKETVQITAEVAPTNATNKKLNWKSSASAVATVDSTGRVTAVAAGSAVITCSATDGSGVTATCKVTVTKPEVKVTGITLDKTEVSLKEKETVQITAEVAPTNATNKKLNWKSSASAVATVDSTGRVTAVAAGSAVITCSATDGSGVTATCKVTVTKPEVKVTRITLNKANASIEKGKTLQLKATVTPTNATTKAVTWKSSNTKIATVSSTGKVTAKATGTVTITCTAKDGSGKKATCKITVIKPTVKATKITINKTKATLVKGEKISLKATVTPTNATNKAVTWKSSNTKIATVSSTGKVTAKATGTVTITCTAKDGSGKKATCKITVRNYTKTESYVARIYTKALGRNPEIGGLKYWTGEINAKRKTPVQVAEAFFFAPEFTNKKLNNTAYVRVLYQTFMGRKADQGGLNYWVDRLNKGESRKSVLEAFAGCPEFQKIVKSFGL